MTRPQSADVLADFLDGAREELIDRIHQEVAKFQAKLSRATIEGWFRDQIALLRGETGHTCEWMALFVNMVLGKGGRIGDLLPMIQAVRNVILDYCQGRVPGLPEVEVFRLVQHSEDLQLRHIGELYGEAERKAATAGQRRERAIADAMREAFALVDAEGRITLANGAFANLAGLTQEGLTGRELASLCAPAAATELRRCLRQKRTPSVYGFEGAFQSGQGAGVAMRFQVQPLFGETGLRSGLAVAMAPVDRDRQPALVPETVEAVARLLGLGLYVIDANLRVVSANEMGRFYAEPGQEDARGRCSHPAAEECGDCLRRRVFDTGQPYYAVARYEMPPGEVRWVDVACLPLRGKSGVVTHVAKLLRDITEQKLLESQLLYHQDASLTPHIAATAAHQLRNPLSVVIGFAEMLSKGMPPDRVPLAVDTILRNGVRCKEIVENLLEFERSVAAHFEAADLNALVRERLQPVFSGPTPVPILWELADHLPKVSCRPDQVLVVCVHLLDNALWAARTRVVFRTEAADGQVAIAVWDDGSGVPEEYRERLFDPFFTTRKDEGGTGLSLCLSQRVVQMHQGRLYLDPATETGACFRVELPASGPALEAIPEPVADEPEPRPGRRILLVEDEPDQMFLLTLALQQLGHNPDTAANGAEALEQIASHTYDVAVIDLLLGDEFCGKDLYQMLLQTNPELARRTIFITGDTMKYETRLFLQEAARPFLEKPFMMDEFARLVERVLQEPGPGPG